MIDRVTNPLNNWETNAIMVDVAEKIEAHWLKCPWCSRQHQLIIEPNRVIHGRHLCDCGEFFRFAVCSETGATEVVRCRARPKSHPLMEVYHGTT